jgi:hypothetical protein
MYSVDKPTQQDQHPLRRNTQELSLTWFLGPEYEI